MTHDEKRKLAIARELDELRRISRSLDLIVADAQKQAEELRAAATRMQRIADEERQVDQAIADLERLHSQRRVCDVDPLGATIIDITRAFSDYTRRGGGL